ncbi:helix-turn-helix domain-containing protein [Bacillus sp. 31A1R]|uniref:Helix-turn-helix domain-containing protein n=1 Tax=Robertmurraya mangrovi TaxID=3098077 RepID=A0ABU5IYH5_9BACI|nr:helix-turn-helix domain-containing protein [Bacillus sp. 31A1R]MDZ5472229.1 helix-turn-helix domain-containing protein [Bacillus sp. 31A1R]
MNFDPIVSEVASMISEESRSAMLLTLLDGRKYTVSELAMVSKITPQTASFHLTKMIEKGIVLSEKLGRHKYLSMANGEVARVLESLLCMTPDRKPNSFREVARSKEIHLARTCYDHLAGTLGVEITNFLLKNNFIIEKENSFDLTENGERYLSKLGINIKEVRKKRRTFSCKCLDWSERRFHLAGALGHSILLFALENHWVERMPLTRALKISARGRVGFRDVFEIEILFDSK